MTVTVYELRSDNDILQIANILLRGSKSAFEHALHLWTALRACLTRIEQIFCFSIGITHIFKLSRSLINGVSISLRAKMEGLCALQPRRSVLSIDRRTGLATLSYGVIGTFLHLDDI